MPPTPSYAEVDAKLCRPGTIFEIEEKEIRGCRIKTWKRQPVHFRQFFEERMSRWRDRVMLSTPRAESLSEENREVLTYGEVWDRAVRLAAWLRDREVRAGTRVAIGGRNCAGWMVSFIAVCLLGAVPVLLNSTLVVEAQLHCLGLTKPALVLCDPEDASVLGPMAAELTARGVGPVFCWSSLTHVDPAARSNVGELVPGFAVSSKSLEEVRTGKGFGLESVHADSDCMVLFTSGTTSMPKGVLETQRACLTHVISSSIPAARAIMRMGGTVEMALAAHEAPPEQGAMLLAVPLFHVTGLLGWMSRGVHMGMKMVFMKRWSTSAAVKLCVAERVTAIGGVPAIATAILQSPELPADHQMEGITYGGAPPPARLAADIQKKWPNAMATHAYGMTETAGLHTGFMGPDYLANPAAVGPAMPVDDIRIVDPETRKVLGPNQPGIVECYGPNIMKEYVDNPKATAEALRDGWVHTGDLAMIDDNGYLVILDRAKDIVIRGGENIASAEVENAIYKDDRIAEAACVPVPCPRLGERVGVCVSLAPGAQATPESIIKEAEARLRYPARPAIVLVHDGPLPRNANGKIVKSDIKKIVGDAWKVQQAAEAEPRAKL